MRREDLLRRLEERLARGEISERTYLDIKARYDAMPEGEANGPEPEAPDAPSLDALAGLGPMIQEAVTAALKTASEGLEAAVATQEVHHAQREVEERMREVQHQVAEAMHHIGPRVEAGGRKVAVRGAGVFPGDLATEEFHVTGSCRVEGNLTAKEAHIAGRCRIGGDVESVELHSAGKTEIGGSVRATEVHTAGAVRIGGGVRAKEVSIAGKAEVGGDIAEAAEVRLGGFVRVRGSVGTKEFTSKGAFEVGGGIEAQDVRIRLQGRSSVPQIRAKGVEVRRGDRRSDLRVETIEAQEVYVEATRAKLIRGRDVRVGPFCTVDVVEADTVEVHESSTVKERRGPAGG